MKKNVSISPLRPQKSLQTVFTIPQSPTPPTRRKRSSRRGSFEHKRLFSRSSKNFAKNFAKNFVRKESRDRVPICEDAILLVCCYLNKKDLRSLSATSLRFRSVTTSYHLHISYILHHPFVPKVRSPYTPLTVRDETSLSSSLFFLPHQHTPTSLHGLTADQLPPLVSFNMSPTSSPKSLFPNSPNIPIDPPSIHLLTSLLIPHPTCIDPATLSHSSFLQYDLNEKSVIQFVGPIGHGDRCMRSKLPFPSLPPKRRSSALQHLLPSFTPRPLAPLLELMKNNKCHYNPIPEPDEFDTQIRPEGHVLPTLQIDLTPRLWSYFEVSVSPRDPKIESKASAANADPNTLSEIFINSSASLIECIAIGLSTESFPLSNKMPGWDANSFGYHSDDGGIFRNNGDMVREFGPKWGEGDTVGCGIYYAEGGG
ncbi:hypothetical protein TrRE_jg13076, partial [Triparma retinervis]